MNSILTILASLWNNTILNPVFLCAVSLILIFERLYPVNPQQAIFSRGFLHDSVWLILALLFEGLVVAAYTKTLRSFYYAHLSFLTPSVIEHFPEIGRFMIGVLATDFLAWFQHFLKHKIPWFWQIHAVHHSQREINMFTDLRFHFLEYIISRTIIVIPLLIVGIETPKIAAYAVFTTWFTRFYHANIKSNFGFLRYLFVSPQSHRIHHSIERRHQDKNFGVLFSFWDRIFRTQWNNCFEYPETGIEDSTFPLEKETSLLSLLMTPLQQLIHPFVAISRSLIRKSNAERKF
jgi:sterol desaturase/sphingolipid hydroxylase (fatty acid hydroxylase superfamily)